MSSPLVDRLASEAVAERKSVMLLSCREMQQWEAQVFASGVPADSLMEEAGLSIAEALRQFFPRPGRLLVYFGKGHNGGDALVAARHLGGEGWAIDLHSPFGEGDLAELTAQKLQSARPNHRAPVPPGATRGGLVILDGLLGIGARPGLRDPILAAAKEINRLRDDNGAQVIAIDVPTGLDADTGQADANCVRADYTFAIGAVKQGLVADEATGFVGRLALLRLTELRGDGGVVAAAMLTTPETISNHLPRRRFDSHKGHYGHVAVIAGSPGLTGAAVMAGEGALRAGAGLVTLFVTPDIWPIVAASAPAELMVKPVEKLTDALAGRFDAWALGPGLGQQRREEVRELIRVIPQPMVIDADALNILSLSIDDLHSAAGPRLLTPHPGEMRRLFPDGGERRGEAAADFVRRFPVTLLLKGARTVVAEKDKPISFNSTGTPAMAAGGMGDVLTGVCAALSAQGLVLYDSARLGAWLCGRAAEIALERSDHSEETLQATDLFKFLGAAFNHLRRGCF